MHWLLWDDEGAVPSAMLVTDARMAAKAAELGRRVEGPFVERGGRPDVAVLAITAVVAGFTIGQAGRAGAVGWVAMVGAAVLFLWTFWRVTR